MRLIRSLDHIPADAKGSVLALGNFDGMHRGHQAILTHCIDFARADGKKPAAMTFEPHPREFFSPDHKPHRLYPLRRKIELLRDCGIEILFLVRFNKKFAATSADAFIYDILHQKIAASHVVTGYDFAFGKGRAGTTEALAEAGHKLGFGFTALPAVTDENIVISSSAVRTALANGDIRFASHMLGHDYEIEGRVRRGEQRGRQLGFPTANLSLAALFKPRLGVYAVRASFDGASWHDGVANVGIKPTFYKSDPLLEVHFFDVKRDFYGEKMRVKLLGFIRDEKKFANLEELKLQIMQDCKQAKTILAQKKVA